MPYTLHPHPTPYTHTLHPTPYTLHPAFCTLHPTPYTKYRWRIGSLATFTNRADGEPSSARGYVGKDEDCVEVCTQADVSMLWNGAACAEV